MNEADAVQVATRVVRAPCWGEDGQAGFPRDRVEALGRAGLLGLTASQASGGGGAGLAEAVPVVRRIAAACASTATVLQAHYAAVAVLDRHGPPALRAEIAAGRHLAGLALSEADGCGDGLGSGTAVPYSHGPVVDLTGCKCWVAAAGEADSYLWSAGAFAGAARSLWLVPANAPGLHVPARSRSAGLRGAAVAPVTADPVRVPADNLLGAGELVDDLVVPWFVVLGAAVALGVIDGTLERIAGEAARRPDSQAALAEIRVRADSVRSLLDDALAAVATGRPDAATVLPALRAVASGAAVAVTELAAELLAGWGHGSGSATRAAVERRRSDALAAQEVPPSRGAELDHIVRGLWLAAPRPGATRELATAGPAPR